MGVLGFIQSIREGNRQKRALDEAEHRTDVAQSLAVLQAIQAQQNREQSLSADIAEANASINQALVNESMLQTALSRAREVGDQSGIDTALAAYSGARSTREGLQSNINSLRGQRELSRAQTGQLMDFMAKHTMLQDVVTQTVPLIQQMRQPQPQNAGGQTEDQMGAPPAPAHEQPTTPTTAAPAKTPTTIETAQELQGDQATIQPAMKDGRISLESTQPPIQQTDEKGRVIGEQQVPPSFVSPEGLPVPPDQFAKNLATLANAGPMTQAAAQRDLYGASVQYLDALTQTGDVQRSAEGSGFVRNLFGPNSTAVTTAQTEIQRLGSAGQGNRNFMHLLRDPTPLEAAQQFRKVLDSSPSTAAEDVRDASATTSGIGVAAQEQLHEKGVQLVNYLSAFVGEDGKLPKDVSASIVVALSRERPGQSPFPFASQQLSKKNADQLLKILQPADAKRLRSYLR